MHVAGWVVGSRRLCDVRISDFGSFSVAAFTALASSQQQASSTIGTYGLRYQVRYAPGTPLLFIPINLVDIFCYFSKKFSHFL